MWKRDIDLKISKNCAQRDLLRAGSECSFEAKKSVRSENMTDCWGAGDKKDCDTSFGISNKESISEQRSPNLQAKDNIGRGLIHSRCKSFTSEMISKPLTINFSVSQAERKSNRLLSQSESGIVEQGKSNSKLFDKYLAPPEVTDIRNFRPLQSSEASNDWTTGYLKNLDVPENNDHYQLRKIRGPVEIRLEASIENHSAKLKKVECKNEENNSVKVSAFLEKTKNSVEVNLPQKEFKQRPNITFGNSLAAKISKGMNKRESVTGSFNLNSYLTSRHSRPAIFKVSVDNNKSSTKPIEPIPETIENATPSHAMDESETDNLEKLQKGSILEDKAGSSSSTLKGLELKKNTARRSTRPRKQSLKFNELRDQRKVCLD